MHKGNTNNSNNKENLLFSLSEVIPETKVRVDFDAPDISSNGGLYLSGNLSKTIAGKIGSLIPDSRRKASVQHSYIEMVSQRVGQILCGYEDANDCDRLRGDSALKAAAGLKPSDKDLCSQPTMSRLENNIDSKTLYSIGKAFVDEFISSFDKAPGKVILDADDTNADTYGAQELTLFNAYYKEYCYMPLLIFDGISGKMILPMLRPGRRNKELNVFRILRRVVEYLHKKWPKTKIVLRGDSHFCSHDFMDWAYGQWYVGYLTGLSKNNKLMEKVDKPLRRARNDYKKAAAERKRKVQELVKSGRPVPRMGRLVIKRYYKLDYKAESWKYEQRVIAKIEISEDGDNVRFVVTKNRNNAPDTIYKRYCKRGCMELLIKDLKYFRADRMSCSSYRANYFRLFLYAAAYVVAHSMKHTAFKGTDVENFTMDSFMKRIMLSAVHIVEKKTFIKVSFSPHHRHLDDIVTALKRLSA